MKKQISRLLFFAGLCAAFSTQLSALTIGDAYYIGRINDGIPANPADEVSYINTLITLAAGANPIQIPAGTGETYDRLSSTLVTSFPTAVTTGSFKSGDNPSTTVNVSGFTYLLGKYDQDTAGSYVWYVGGLTGNQTLPATAEDRALSHYSLYNPGTSVPDGGSTIALLGGALVLLAGISRRGFSFA
jgi:hypothetical protein